MNYVDAKFIFHKVLKCKFKLHSNQKPKFQVIHLFLRWIKTELHFVASILHFVRKGDHSGYDFRLWVLIPPQNMMVSPFVWKLLHIYHSRH